MLIEALLEELEQCLHRLARSTGARAEQYLYSHQVVELVEVALDPAPTHAGPGPVITSAVLKETVLSLPLDAFNDQEVVLKPCSYCIPHLLDMPAIGYAVD